MLARELTISYDELILNGGGLWSSISKASNYTITHFESCQCAQLKPQHEQIVEASSFYSLVLSAMDINIILPFDTL